MINALKLHISFYGGLKDHFNARMDICEESIDNVSQLLTFLSLLRPEAVELLDKSAVAIDGKIVKQNIQLEDQFNIALLPPFSGG